MANRGAGTAGAYATSPTAIPKRGWWQVVCRVKDRVADDNLSVVSAGVAFYGFLAIFPMIGAVMTVAGLITDPSAAARQMEPFRQLVPPDAFNILMSQVENVTSAAGSSLSAGLLLSLLLTLWSATKGIKALLVALNIAYEESEQRGFFLLSAIALSFAVGGVAFVIFSLSVIALIPIVVGALVMADAVETVILWIRWPIIGALVMAGLALTYRFGPSRRDARLKWITPGAVTATFLWIAVSFSFSFYVGNFGNYDEVFGSLGAVVVLLLWFYFSAFSVCIGAELNAELELQTYRDTTVGPARRPGKRGAYVADNTAHDEI